MGSYSMGQPPASGRKTTRERIVATLAQVALVFKARLQIWRFCVQCLKPGTGGGKGLTGVSKEERRLRAARLELVTPEDLAQSLGATIRRVREEHRLTQG